MATMKSGLGGAAGYGENSFKGTTKTAGANDDGTISVDVTSVFSGGIDFFGTTYTEIFINSNGSISFGSGSTTASTTAGLNALNLPAIVPFWADINIDAGGDIYWDIDPANGQITITWDSVAPFSGTGTNSFQVVLTDTGGGNFETEIIYGDMQWSDGSGDPASNGVAGITDGGTYNAEFDGSGNTTELLNYETNDFGGGDANGTFTVPFADGLPEGYGIGGSSGDDVMDLGFIDLDGDQITIGDDYVDGGAGNDFIDGDQGNDTILGGAGNDTILSGSNAGGGGALTVVNNGDNLMGTTGQDAYSWAGGAGNVATIRFNNSAAAGDGDGVADFVVVENTDNAGVLTIGDFDVGVDKIYLQESWTGISSASGVSGSDNFFDITLTYGNGNQQSFTIFHDGSTGFSASAIFSTDPAPSVSTDDDDLLSGGDDADAFIIADSFGDDTIIGGEGGTDDDRIDLTALTGAVTVTHSGDGSGTVTDGNGNTITFSEIERIDLTDQADVIDASADTKDMVIGGVGGNDTILSGSGNDVLFGGAGADSISGNAGSDTINGDDGNDALFGGDGDDDIFGGDGNDTILGGLGQDSLLGGAGSDSIDGGAGDDYLFGGDARDYLYLSAGNDTIVGGTNLADYDALDTTYATSSLTVTWTSDTAGTVQMGGDTTTFSNIGFINTYDWTGTQNASIWGTSDWYDASAATGGIQIQDYQGGADTIIGSDFGDLIDVFGTYGLSTDGTSISAGGGDDYIMVEDGSAVAGSSATLDGGAGNDYIYFTSGDGSADVSGGSGNDSIYGSDGAMTIRGGTGDDRMWASDEDDLFIMEDAFGNDDIRGGESDETAGDTIDFSEVTTSGINVTFSGAEAGSIIGGTDTVTFSEIENLTLTNQADTVDGSAATTGINIDGGGGNDSVIGSDLGDTLAGGDGDDYIEGGAGDDFLTTGEGQDTLLGGAGADTLMNSDGDDLLIGGAGDDSIVATGGEDTLQGGTGADYMDGGDDADTFIIEDNFGNDTIIGGEGTTDPGDTDFDTIDLSAMTGPVTVTYTGDEAGTITDGTDTITFSEIERIILTDQNDSVDGAADSVGISIEDGGGDDTITGGSGNDTIVDNDSNTSRDVISGGAGNDSITAGGYDTVYAGDGDDTVSMGYSNGGNEAHGGAGNDSLTGTNGNQALYGGAGNDTINGGDDIGTADRDTLDGGDGNDSITSGMTSTPNDAGWQANGDLMSGGAGDDTIVGGTAEDTISGGTGNDSMSGGQGSDTFIVEDGFGNDTILGGEGAAFGDDTDTIDLSAMTGPFTVTYTGDEAGTITDGTDTITFSEIERVITTDQNDSVDGSAQWPGLFGDAPGMNVETRGGNDTVTGGRGGDTIDAGTGNDSIDGDYGDDSIDGGDGSDTLLGGTGNDTLAGGAGNDSLSAGVEDDTLTGGTGDDTLTGGDGDDTFIYNVGDGADTITDFNTGNSGALGDGDSTNNDFIDLGSFYDNLTELREDFNDDGVLNQSNSTSNGGTVDYSDNSEMQPGDSLTFQGADQSSFTADNTGVVCFTAGTAIRTPRGDVLIDDLKVGDLVTTMDNGPQRIAWIGKRHVTRSELFQSDRLHPVLIKKGILGAERDLLVSRQHGMLLGQDYLGRAVHLAKTMPGVRVAKGARQVTYVHLMFEAHQIIFAEGIPSESFYPGPMALEMLSNASREEMRLIFPKLTAMVGREDIIAAYGNTARAFLENKKAVSAWLNGGSGVAKKEIREWDVDMVMEQFEAERMFRTVAPDQVRNGMCQVA